MDFGLNACSRRGLRPRKADNAVCIERLIQRTSKLGDTSNTRDGGGEVLDKDMREMRR